MNRSKKFSKWPVFALTLLLLSGGSTALRAQDGGWYSPIGKTASMDRIAAVHSLQYVDEGDGAESGAIQQTSYNQAPRRMPARRPIPRRPMRMAMNGGDDLSWSLDEDPNFSFAETAAAMQGQAEVLPDDAIRVRPKEAQPADGALNAVPVSESDEPETGWEGDNRKGFEDLVPSFDPAIIFIRCTSPGIPPARPIPECFRRPSRMEQTTAAVAVTAITADTATVVAAAFSETPSFRRGSTPIRIRSGSARTPISGSIWGSTGLSRAEFWD